MNNAEEIISLVTDSRIDDDAWSDVFIVSAFDLFEAVSDENEIRKLFDTAKKIDSVHRSRLLQVLLSREMPDYFDDFLSLLDINDTELVEVIFDNLRSWSLSRIQGEKLLKTYNDYKGKSPLLDYVMKDFEFRLNEF